MHNASDMGAREAVLLLVQLLLSLSHARVALNPRPFQDRTDGFFLEAIGMDTVFLAISEPGWTGCILEGSWVVLGNLRRNPEIKCLL